MQPRTMLCRIAVLLALAVVVFGSQGCTYAKNRYHDAADMIDLGVSLSYKPGIGLYWNSLDTLVFGYSNFDGYFVGWGGGQIGATRLYSHCYGFIVSKEEVGWGDFDKDDPRTLFVRYGGLLGLASLAGHPTPDYTPACVHFFPHLGFVGIVWNARWTQIVDFVLGWTTIDLAGDDGTKFGHWPGLSPWGREPD